jgi:hypothetical protein
MYMRNAGLLSNRRAEQNQSQELANRTIRTDAMGIEHEGTAKGITGRNYMGPRERSEQRIDGTGIIR